MFLDPLRREALTSRATGNRRSDTTFRSARPATRGEEFGDRVWQSIGAHLLDDDHGNGGGGVDGQRVQIAEATESRQLHQLIVPLGERRVVCWALADESTEKVK